MHRMRNLFALSALVVTALSLLGTPATASLIRNPAGRAYPDIAGDINGTVTYTYGGSGSGTFQMSNTPYLIAGGKTAAEEFSILPDATGVRSQVLNLTLDSSGSLLADAANSYELRGTIEADGRTFSGLLLQGTPTAFGFQDLGATPADSDIFDVEMTITGGALAPYFGADAYLRITPELASTFRGRFDESFAAEKATSNTRGYNSPQPFPIPEPTTLLVVLFGGAGMVYRQRRRLAR